ncbi:MAG: inositol monophosphatase [Gammaproteobacteria bacterium]|nr:inositol monophosphatase [Gammaproteobacteria bacterium]
MHPMLNTAITAARKAGNIIARSVDRIDSLTITSKAQNDFVTEVDQKAEMTIIEIISKAYPSHSFLGEETGRSGDSEYLWIIDPLDGTTNFLHGFPQFAVSIALEHKGEITQGVIYDPINQDLFTASKGDGAQLNNRRLRVTGRKSLQGALLGTGFPFKQQQHLDVYLETFKALFPDTAGIRRPGSASLDLAYLAAGRLDGFWEIGLSPWDIAAGVLLVKEAGGMVGDFSGGDEYLKTGNIIAGNPYVYEDIVKRLQPLLPEELRK